MEEYASEKAKGNIKKLFVILINIENKNASKCLTFNSGESKNFEGGKI
jgi:hypothetical protein